MEKLKVTVDPDVTKDGEVVPPFPEDILYEKMAEAGWSDDPGTGKAILTPGGSEIVSPMPVAPPIGYVQEPSVMDRLNDMLYARLNAMLQGDDVLDETEEEANDFDVPDPEDFHPRSIYELEMLDEVPAIPRQQAGQEPPVAAEGPGEAQSGQNGPA